MIVFIGDATSRLTALQFAPAETTKAYLAALRAHVLAHGVPLAFYSDRRGIFRINAKEAGSGGGYTEFGRVAERQRIELIQATTPQAKGRVERANQTLHDRLIKEMRLRGVCDIEGAQAFAQDFIELWNARFARPPLDAADAHRPWTKGLEALDEALARPEERVLSKALTFSAGGKVHCVKTSGTGTGPCGSTTRTAACPAPISRRTPAPIRLRMKRPSTPEWPQLSWSARPVPKFNPSARKGVDNAGLRYSAMGARFRPALSTPTQPAPPNPKGDILMLR